MREENILRGLRYGKLDSRTRAYVAALALIKKGKASLELMNLIVDIDDNCDKIATTIK